MEYKTIGGILLLMIATSIGTVYFKEAGGYTKCSTGWIPQDNGQFVCESRDILPQWCYKFSDPNKETGISSRCYLGVPVIEDPVQDQPQKIIVEETVAAKGDYTTSPDGSICYLKGDLRRGVPCET